MDKGEKNTDLFYHLDTDAPLFFLLKVELGEWG